MTSEQLISWEMRGEMVDERFLGSKYGLGLTDR